jgi:hypothetical protein
VSCLLIYDHTVLLIGSTITIYDYDLRLQFTITNRTTPYDFPRKCILELMHHELVTAALWSVDPLIYKWSGDPYSHARYFPKTHSSPTPIYKPDQEANATFSLSHHLLNLTHLLHLLHLSTERDYLVLSCLVFALCVCVCVFALLPMLLSGTSRARQAHDLRISAAPVSVRLFWLLRKCLPSCAPLPSSVFLHVRLFSVLLRLYGISLGDAFSKVAFGGNPAAVCLISNTNKKHTSDVVRQSIAAEMNLSETAFVEPLEGEVLS